jgi:long-chain fatty acid transport protein
MTRNDALPKVEHLISSTRARLSLSIRGAASAGALLALLSAAGSARASGFLNPRIGDPHGSPALANGYAIYFNPAALGGIEGSQVLLDGTLAYRTVDYQRAISALSPSAIQPLTSTYAAANTGNSHAANFAEIPFVAASSDFGRRDFFGGVGAYVPFGGAVKFDQNPTFANYPDARGAVDGRQRWAVISATQRSLYLTAVAGLRLPEAGLSFALGGSLVLSEIIHNQARNLDGHDDVTTEGRALLDVSGTHAAFSAGVYWEALPKKALRLGVSYSVRPAFGELRMRGTLSQHYSGDAVKDVDFLQNYPDVLRLGVAGRPWGDTVELRFDAEYVTWSVFDRQCILDRGAKCTLNADGSDPHMPPQIILAVQRHWHNAGAVRAGAGWFIDDKTELYGSLGFDTSAVPTSTLEATYPDSFKLMASIGARRQLSDLFTLGVSYSDIYYLPQTTEHQQQSQLSGVSRVPNEDGTYKSTVMFFNVNGTFSF